LPRQRPRQRGRLASSLTLPLEPTRTTPTGPQLGSSRGGPPTQLGAPLPRPPPAPETLPPSSSTRPNAPNFRAPGGRPGFGPGNPDPEDPPPLSNPGFASTFGSQCTRPIAPGGPHVTPSAARPPLDGAEGFRPKDPPPHFSASTNRVAAGKGRAFASLRRIPDFFIASVPARGTGPPRVVREDYASFFRQPENSGFSAAPPAVPCERNCRPRKIEFGGSNGARPQSRFLATCFRRRSGRLQSANAGGCPRRSTAGICPPRSLGRLQPPCPRNSLQCPPALRLLFVLPIIRAFLKSGSFSLRC